MIRNKKFENFDSLITSFLPLDGNETLYSHKTWNKQPKLKSKSRNTNEMLLVMFQVWQELPEINLQVFPASIWERGHFSCLSTFQTLDYGNSKNVRANPCGFIRNSKKELLNNCAKFH